MNGYEYLIARNRLMQRLEEELAQLAPCRLAEREKETKRLQAKFDFALAELYAKVADEYPGERKNKARPICRPALGPRGPLAAFNQYSGRAHSQPRQYLARNSARQADRRHGRFGLGQIEPGVRHALCRGAAPLRAEPLDLRAAVPRADGAAGRRCDFRNPAGARAAPEEHHQECALDGRHRHRNQRLPAAAVCDGRKTMCPRCGSEVTRDTVEAAGAQVLATPGLYIFTRAVRDGLALASEAANYLIAERIPSPVRRRRDGRDRGVAARAIAAEAQNGGAPPTASRDR